MPSQEAKEKQLRFKIGCDPEFSVNAGDKCLDAREFFMNTFGATLSTDEAIENREAGMGFTIGNAGNVGWDGCSSTGEMRPSAENNIKAIADNIQTMLVEIAKKTNIVSLKSLSLRIPLGGHIHLELPFKPKLDGSGDSLAETQRIDAFTKKAIKLLATMWVPLMLGESKVNINGRLRHGYGGIVDNRTGIHGSARTLELRCPTAEWLTTRKICEATFMYLACVWNEILINGAGLKKSKNITFSSNSQASSVQKMLLMDYKTINESLVKNVSSAIKTFELYPTFKNEIDYILDYKTIIKDKNECGFDILKGWNIQGEKTKVTKQEFIGKKKFIALSKKINLDILGNIAPIQFNGDREVDKFASELSRRIVAFNLNIKNNIVLFGLRKGIDNIIAFNNKKELFINNHSLFKSRKDLLIIRDEIMSKLLAKYTFDKSQSIKKYEWKHARTKGDTDQIFIGIPYDTRNSGDMREFLRTSYQVITGKMNASKIETLLAETPETAKDGVDAIKEADKDEQLIQKININESRANYFDATEGLILGDEDNEETEESA